MISNGLPTAPRLAAVVERNITHTRVAVVVMKADGSSARSVLGLGRGNIRTTGSPGGPSRASRWLRKWAVASRLKRGRADRCPVFAAG